MRAFRAAEQLSAILASAVLPPSARALAERVEARLSAPVRIAVVGVPEAGKRRIVEGLLGGAVLPAVAGLPPAEIALGAGDRIGVVTGDGAEARIDVAEFHQLDPADLALIRLSAPLPLLEKIRFLVVPLEGGAAEMRAALSWTFRRADMVLWCMPRLGGPERALWPAIPEGLRDHAYLAVTRPAPVRPTEAERMEAANYFAETRDLTDGEGGAECITRLRSALLAHVSRARREDLEGALIFLDHHLSRPARDRLPPLAPSATGAMPAGEGGAPADGAASRAGSPRAVGPGADPGTPSTALPDGGPGGGAPAAPGLDGLPAVGARTPERNTAPPPAAAQIIDLLAAKGARLAELEGAGGVDAARALDLCAEALDACAELARDEGGGVADLIDEAVDLMVLLQLEGSRSALSDAVALLCQVRREGEACLAA
jgi:hypothetical protein